MNSNCHFCYSDSMIVKAALLLFEGEGKDMQLLMVRSKGKPYFVFPGGKVEPGETIDQALHRELAEELQVALRDIKGLTSITGETPDGRILEEHLFVGRIEGEPRPSHEIEEMIWLTRADMTAGRVELTPISVGKIFPYLQEKGIW